MEIHDETRTLRRRFAAGEQSVPPPLAATGSPTVVGRVVDGGNLPTTTPNQFLITPVRVGGPLVEGGEFETSSTGDKRLCCSVLGGPAPGVGELLVVRRCGGRWVAVGPAGGATPNTTFVGDVASFCFNKRVDSDVEITRDDDATVLWTGTTTTLAGYSDAIALDEDTDVTVTATPTTSRLVAASYSFTMHAGVPNPIPAIILPRAPGYYCAEFCAYPIGASLTYLHRASGETIALMRGFVFPPAHNFAGAGNGTLTYWGGTGTSPDGTSATYVFYRGDIMGIANDAPGGGAAGTAHDSPFSNPTTCYDGTATFQVTYVTAHGSLGGGYHDGQLIDVTEP